MNAPALRIVLAQPRGFGAGAERAIEIVERALERFGPPAYVRHEIVHNRHVVEMLKSKGARFMDEVDEIPRGSVAAFSAHGVAEAAGTPSYLIDGAETLDPAWLNGARTVGITAGASAPELLVQELNRELGERYAVQSEVLAGSEENVHFRLPPALAERGVPAALDRPRAQ